MTHNASRQPSDHFPHFADKMRQAGVPELAIQTFRHYYTQLLAGATGFIDCHEAGPVDALPDYDSLTDDHLQRGTEALDRAVVIKLNGGLGTSMGMQGPKSLVVVKDGLSFLDITVQQIRRLREETDARLPLVLMNTAITRPDSLAALQSHSGFDQDIPFDFLQHINPKVDAASYKPASWPDDTEKEWCPPGHGDLYAALVTSGMLDQMLDAGYEYIFVSNSDNLGAVLDPRILGYFAANDLPFLMEVAYRTKADSKGGHLSRRPDGQLILREYAQCPPDEQEQFQDIERYRFFNTNNLWLHLPTLLRVLQQQQMMLDLPLIRNEKHIDPTDPTSPKVYQLETAMGSAISRFGGAQALRVPRNRFIPVKKTNDLLLLWSDVYELTPDYRLILSPERRTEPVRRPPLIYLDDRYYQLIDDLTLRFPHGAPSMLQCNLLRVQGDVHFGRNVTLEGGVEIVNSGKTPQKIGDGARLSGRVVLPTT